MSCFKLEKASIPKNANDSLLKCYITNLDYKKISLQFACYKDDYINFVNDLTKHYRNIHSSKSLAKLPRNQYSIQDDLFVFKSEGQFYRAQILEQWPNQKYMIFLMDEGFKFFADSNSLFLLDEQFLNFPAQGFNYYIYVDNTFDPMYKYIINYIIQKTICSFYDFSVKFDSTNQEMIHLFYLNKSNKIIALNDLIQSIINNFNLSKFEEEISDDKLEKYLHNYSVDGDGNNGEANISTKMAQSSGIQSSISSDEFNGKIKIKQIISPSKFYVKRLTDDSFVQFKLKLNNYFDQNKPEPVKKPILNTIYAAEHNDKWYRVLLINLDQDWNEMIGLLIDKGYENCYSINELFELPNELSNYPPRSIAATLDFVKPKNGSEWDEEAIDFFTNQLCNQIVEFQSNGFDESLKTERCNVIVGDENMADILFENGFAECVLEDII